MSAACALKQGMTRFGQPPHGPAGSPRRWHRLGHRFTALMYASKKGHAGVVELLLQAGAYASASSRGKAEVAQLLLAAPLQMASADGHADIVRLLLEAHAGTDLVDGCGDTALMRASSGGHASVVNLLLQAGADASLVNCLGYTSVMLMSSGDHSEVAELLLADNTNPNTPCQGQVAVEGLPEASETNLLDDSGSTVVDHSDFYRRAVKFLRDHCCGTRGSEGKELDSLSPAIIVVGLRVHDRWSLRLMGPSVEAKTARNDLAVGTLPRLPATCRHTD